MQPEIPIGLILLGIFWTLISYSFLRILPPPRGTPENFYSPLLRPTAYTRVSLLSLISLGLTALAPEPHRPLWWVLATSFSILVWIDHQTMFLPRTLQISGLMQLLLALFVCWFWLGLPSQDSLRAIIGGTSASLIFLAIWWFGKGALGFGDVRLAGSLFLVAASHSWEFWWTSLFMSAVFGTGWAFVKGRRGQQFPYGPALYLGVFSTLLLYRLTDGS